MALNWGAVANASKYRVQYRSATGEWTVDYDSITGTSHTVDIAGTFMSERAGGHVVNPSPVSGEAGRGQPPRPL